MGFHCIVDWRVGGKSTHIYASFLYTSFVGRINIYILNYPESFHFSGEGQAIRGWPGSAVGPEQAPTNLPSYKSFHTEVFPGPDTPFLVPKQNPSRPLYTPLRSIHVPEPDTSPTSFHSILISSFHVLHSLNKCSLLCLPPPHHQQEFESIHPNFSFREGAIIACPNAKWKN